MDQSKPFFATFCPKCDKWKEPIIKRKSTKSERAQITIHCETCNYTGEPMLVLMAYDPKQSKFVKVRMH